jgi:YtkA-like
MTQRTRERKPSVRPTPRARPGRRSRLSRRYLLLLLSMAYGSTVALLLVTFGFTSLVRHGGTPGGAHHQQAASGTEQANHGGPQPDIRITARHVGNLVLDIKAEVTMNRGDALMKAKVVAFTDMAQMPGAHIKGPLPLRESPGKPGLYETTTQLPMPGDYKIRIVVEEPVQGEQTTTVPVDPVDTTSRR